MFEGEKIVGPTIEHSGKCVKEIEVVKVALFATFKPRLHARSEIASSHFLGHGRS